MQGNQLIQILLTLYVINILQIAQSHNAFLVNCNRNNQDSHLNNSAKSLLDLRIIINGRNPGDSFDENIYYSNEVVSLII